MSIISKQNKTSLNRERGFIPSSHSACTLAHCFLQDRVSQGYNKQPVLPLIRGPKMFSEIELFITAPLMAELTFEAGVDFWSGSIVGITELINYLSQENLVCYFCLSAPSSLYSYKGYTLLKYIHPACHKKSASIWFFCLQSAWNILLSI